MTYLVQMTIPYYTGTGEDVITNTFHFDYDTGGPPSDANYLALAALVKSFYTNITTVSATAQWAPWMKLTDGRCKIYDLDDPLPRVPKKDILVSYTGAKATTSILPPEAAAVLSYKAAPVSGVNRQSTRGRIYLGGFADNIIEPGGSSSFPSFTLAFRAAVTNAASILLAATEPADTWHWVVYSRKLDQSFQITNGYFDTAIDTQRRRGNTTGTRTVWP